MVFVIAAGLLGAACGISDNMADPDILTFAPVTDETAVDPIFLLPGPLDFPLEILGAMVSDEVTAAVGEMTGIVLGVPTDDGFADLVMVGVGEAVGADFDLDAEGVTLIDINGVEAWITDSLTGTMLGLVAGDRLAIVTGPRGMSDLVVEVAAAVDPSATGEAVLTAVPGGYRIVDTLVFATQVAGEPAAIDSTSWSVLLDVDGQSAIINADHSPTGSWPLAGLIGAERMRSVEIRGTNATLSTTTLELGEFAEIEQGTITMTTLSWMERPDLTIRVSGTAEVDKLLAIAESLTEVPRDEFESFDLLSRPPPLTTAGG